VRPRALAVLRLITSSLGADVGARSWHLPTCAAVAQLHFLAGKKHRRADGLACSQPIGYKALLLVFVGARPFRAGEFVVGAMSDLKDRLITICMLVGALAMIGLVLTGTLQMRVSRSPVAQIAIK
jgi:hypothetical protein